MGKIVLNETQYKRLQNILVENEIYRSLLNEELLMEKTYDITLMQKGGNNFWLKAKDKITKFKVTEFNKDMVGAEVTIKDGDRDENNIPVQFDCKKPDVIEFTGDFQIKGSKYRTDEKLKNIIKWYCAGKPNKKDTKKINQGGGGEDSKKEYAYTKIKPSSNRDIKIPGGNLYFRCEPYTKQSHFKFNNNFYKNEVLQNRLINNFCKNKKTSYTQEKDQSMITTDLSKGSNMYFISPKNSIWTWVGKKEEVEIIPQYQAVYNGGGGSENYDTSEFDLYI